MMLYISGTFQMRGRGERPEGGRDIGKKGGRQGRRGEGERSGKGRGDCEVETSRNE